MADPLSVTGSAVGIISLGLTVCQGLLQYYGSWKDHESNVASMFGSLERLTKILLLLEASIKDRGFNSKIVANVEESITACQSGITSLQKKLDKVKAIQSPHGSWDKIRSHGRRALYPFKESTLVKLGEIITELRDNLNLAVETLHMWVTWTPLTCLLILGQFSDGS